MEASDVCHAALWYGPLLVLLYGTTLYGYRRILCDPLHVAAIVQPVLTMCTWNPSWQNQTGATSRSFALAMLVVHNSAPSLCYRVYSSQQFTDERVHELQSGSHERPHPQ